LGKYFSKKTALHECVQGLGFRGGGAKGAPPLWGYGTGAGRIQLRAGYLRQVTTALLSGIRQQVLPFQRVVAGVAVGLVSYQRGRGAVASQETPPFLRVEGWSGHYKLNRYR